MTPSASRAWSCTLPLLALMGCESAHRPGPMQDAATTDARGEPQPPDGSTTEDDGGEQAPDDGGLDASSDAASDASLEPIPEPDASLEVGATFVDRDPAYLFDQNVVRTFELYLSRENLAKLDADPAAEEYVSGRLAFEGGLIDDVGIRYKGSVGSFAFCLSQGSFPPRGSKLCTKLGMKIKIDYVDDDALFFRQTKIQFHALNLDSSLLRERFGYALFNSLGVHAPRTAHVRMVVNGKFIGIFLLVEVIDSPFTRERFADGGEGNLYKEVWPVGLDEEPYVSALETNKKSADVTKMVSLAEALSGADDQTLPDVVEHWVDRDYTARFIAVDRALRHDDGPHHWYCDNGQGAIGGDWYGQRSYAGALCGNHNYFWYEDTVQDRFWPIPWDLDNTLQAGTRFTALASVWDDLNVDCSALLPAAYGAPQMPITCDPLHRGFALSLREKVKETLQTLAAGRLSDAQVEAQLGPWVAQLEPVIMEANAAGLSEPALSSWASNVSSLRLAISILRDQALSEAGGAP